MGEIKILIAVKDGKVASQISRKHAMPQDVALSIAGLELLLKKEIELFEKFNSQKKKNG